MFPELMTAAGEWKLRDLKTYPVPKDYPNPAKAPAPPPTLGLLAQCPNLCSGVQGVTHEMWELFTRRGNEPECVSHM